VVEQKKNEISKLLGCPCLPTSTTDSHTKTLQHHMSDIAKMFMRKPHDTLTTNAAYAQFTQPDDVAIRGRKWEEKFLHEPTGCERPCANAASGTCFASMLKTGQINDRMLTLCEFYVPMEYEKIRASGWIWPKEIKPCLLCLRADMFAMYCDLVNTQGPPTDPKGQLLFESDIAEAAIKQLVTTSDKAQDMHSENRKLKRQHENIGNNLCNFETGRVEASARNKRHQPVVTEDSFIEWRAKNQSALKWQVDAELQRRARSQSGAVVVNASRQKWKEPTSEETDDLRRPVTSSVYTNYPEMASTLMQLNMGKLIGSEETMQMMQTTPSVGGNSRQMPW